MVQSQRVFKVFIASPSDLGEERSAAEGVVNDVNLLMADSLKARFELISWERNVRPGMGSDAQDVVNEQINDSYDVFLGLMWGRFGSPTSRAESGTEEEFNRALARHKLDPDSIEIMFYFKDFPIPPSQIDPHQLLKVQGFRKRFEDECGGLSSTLGDVEDFRSKLRMHLSSTLRSMAGRPANTFTQLPSLPIPTAVLKHFSALTDDDFDDGFMELSEQAADTMAELVPLMERVAEATSSIGEKMRLRTAEMEASKVAGSVVNREDAKRIVNATADDIEWYVTELAAIIPEYQKKQAAAFDLFGKAVVLANADFQEPVEDAQKVLESVQGLKDNMNVSIPQVAALRNTIAGLPRMTTPFNRARRRAVALLDDLISEIATGSIKAADIERLLLQRIDKLGGQV